jgi:chromosomal replication initiation ATPase DnaA
MWEIKNTIKPLISFPELGRLFGGRDHTTALHSVNSISSKIAAGVLSVDEDGKVTLPKAFA